MRDAARRAPGAAKIHRERRGARQVLGDCQSCNTHKRQVLECIDCLCPFSASPYRPCVSAMGTHTLFSQGNAAEDPEKRTLENAICEHCSQGDYPYFHPDSEGGFL